MNTQTNTMNLYEVAPAEYHRKLTCKRENISRPDSWLSKSELWELKSGSLYKWRFHSKPQAVTAAMQWGTLIDCLTTTPELAETELAISEFDDFRTKAARAAYQELLNLGIPGEDYYERAVRKLKAAQ